MLARWGGRRSLSEDVREAAARSRRPGFRLCGRESGAASYEELARELVFTDAASLREHLERLEAFGVGELMIAEIVGQARH